MDHAREEASWRPTADLLGQARQVLAYNPLDWIVLRPLLRPDGGVFPVLAASADGYELVDTTGRKYIDWVNGWGPALLGYRRKEVEEAIQEQLTAGPTLSLLHPIEIEVAGMLTEMIPCAEMVAFGKNGSDVLTAAVRVARTATGRSIILYHGMHGFHDWFACSASWAQGIPEVLRPLIHHFPYNDLAALEDLFERYPGQVAAVVMEPVRDVLPAPGYLESVRTLTERYGSVLIFDEVVTAFRLANGGAQEHFGVLPDLACLGKAMANGMPLSALVGRRRYMDHVQHVAFGMTYRGETLSLAAARAVLRVLQTEPVTDHLARIGTAIRERFERDCQQLGAPCSLHGPPARMTFWFTERNGRSADSQRALFLQECLNNGVLTNGNLLPSYAHDDHAVERSAEGLRKALIVLVRAIEAGGEDPAPELRACVSTGFIERCHEEQGHLLVAGWMVLEDCAPDSFEILSLEGSVLPAETVERPDLREAFPTHRQAQRGGYWAALPEAQFVHDGEWRFLLRARRGSTIAFECHVRRRIGRAPTVGYRWTGDGVLDL